MLDTERMARKAWTQALADLGYTLDSEAYLRLVGRTVRDAEGILQDLFGSGVPFQEVFRLRQVYYDQDITQNGIPHKPGLLNLLDYLETKQIIRAVATSTPCWFAARKLEHAGIANRFATVVCGDMVERGKPAPDLFLEAARRIDSLPAQCIVLEDSEAGVLATRAAGMLSIMVPDLKLPDPEIRKLAFRVLPSLNEVIPLITEFIQEGLPTPI